MKLKIEKRSGAKKCESDQLRREGKIPAILYSAKSENELITIDGAEFAEILRKIVSGRLSTTKIALVGGDKEVTAIVKEIQYHPTTYQVLHLDLERLVPNSPITVKVPLEFSGVADCAGIKLGGFLRTVLRHVKVKCTPDKMPDVFTLDVKGLSIGQSLRLSAIKMPEGIKPIDDLKEVAVVIAKR